MKLATQKDGTPDGELVVVSRDLRRAVGAGDIAPNLLAALGDYPSLPRRVAMANGSGSRADQGFAPAAQLIRWEYSSFLVSITGNVWALPNQVSGTVFNGRITIFFSTQSQTVTVTGATPWDGAPGGSRATMAQMDSVARPTNIVALHQSPASFPPSAR